MHNLIFLSKKDITPAILIKAFSLCYSSTNDEIYSSLGLKNSKDSFIILESEVKHIYDYLAVRVKSDIARCL